MIRQLYEYQWLYNQYIIKGMSAKEIGEILGCSKGPVIKALGLHKIPIRHQRSITELANKDWVNTQYCKMKKSMETIAKELECNTTSVRQAIIKHRIPVRSKTRYNNLHDGGWLTEQYIVLKKSTVQISNELGCDPSHVLRTIQKNSIRLRSKKEYAGRSISKEARSKMSRAKNGMYIGCLNPNWKGGSSFEPYCYKFNNKLKEEIRKRYQRKCILCNRSETAELEEFNRKLSVHHVDYDKEQGCNGKKWLLVPLCCQCNCKVNYRRDIWKEKIINIIEGDGLSRSLDP